MWINLWQQSQLRHFWRSPINNSWGQKMLAEAVSVDEVSASACGGGSIHIRRLPGFKLIHYSIRPCDKVKHPHVLKWKLTSAFYPAHHQRALGGHRFSAAHAPHWRVHSGKRSPTPTHGWAHKEKITQRQRAAQTVADGFNVCECSCTYKRHSHNIMEMDLLTQLQKSQVNRNDMRLFYLI